MPLALLVSVVLADVVGTVVGAVPGKTIDDAALVGSRGEVYVRQKDAGTWRRQATGGTAASLVAATGVGHDLWAIGPTTPAYHHDGASWFALPISEDEPGRALLANGGAAFAEGNTVFVLANRAWTALPQLNARVVALWSGGHEVVAATNIGHLARWGGGGGWTRLKPPLRPDERVSALLPVVAGALAIGDAGTLVVVDGNDARAVSTDPALGSFRPRLAAAGRKSFVLGDAEGSGWFLASLAGTRLSPVEPVPVPDGQTPVGLVACADGSLIVALPHGALVRGASGWQAEAVDDTPPDTTAHPHPVDPPLELVNPQSQPTSAPASQP